MIIILTGCRYRSHDIDGEHATVNESERLHFAIAVSEDLKSSQWIRNVACKSLMDYYVSQGDAESLMRYYEKVRKLSKKKNEYFEEVYK